LAGVTDRRQAEIASEAKAANVEDLLFGELAKPRPDRYSGNAMRR
jgi:hypothetical protein